MTAVFPALRRARPLLGTLVSIELECVDPAVADAAIDRAFAAVARVHGLMSFHETGSELGLLNRQAVRRAVQVSAETFAVLRLAGELAEASGGSFDVTVAPTLVEWGFLPAPHAACAPDRRAGWRDIELTGPASVRFRRPLWIDLGGIAKGYAVDAALAAMALPPGARAIVNAGGDLRCAGPGQRSVLLRVPGHPGDAAPTLQIEAAALASSCGAGLQRVHAGEPVGPHVDGRTRRTAGTTAFASVVAGTCAVADALTKVVLACPQDAGQAAVAAVEAVLRRFGATAYRYDPGQGWSTLGIDTPGSDA